MVEQVPILVGNVNSLLGLGYSHIEVWQSTDEGGSYSEITAAAASPAVMKSAPASNTFRLGGKLLKLSENGAAEVSISFSSLTDYWTAAQAASRINEVVANLATVDTDGKTIVLTSSTSGRVSNLLVTYCDAPDLGLVVGMLTLGHDARIPLVTDVLAYLYQDVAGSNSDRYKWRFSHNGVSPVSDFSDWVQGVPPPMSGVSIAIATAKFVDVSGRPLQRKVIVAAVAPQELGGVTIGDSATATFVADDTGLLQIPLVQGAKVRIGIEGSPLVREITVPSTATFDLMAALASAPDVFTVQVPLPLLTRRTL